MTNPRDARTDPLELVKLSPPRGWMRWIAVLAAFGGWYVSLDLVRLHYQQPASNPLFQALCGEKTEDGSTFDCQSVLRSEWAVVQLNKDASAPGVPIALFGMAYFAFVGCWFLFVGSPTRTRWSWHLLLMFVVTCGVLQSGQSIYIMLFVLQKSCALCLLAHGCNAVIALMTLVAFPWASDKPAQVPHPSGRLAFVTLMAAFLVAAMHLMSWREAHSRFSAAAAMNKCLKIIQDPELARCRYDMAPVHTELLSAAEDRAWLGDIEAPHASVVFIDPQCHACDTAIDLIQGLMAKHPGQLRLDIRHFPLDGACNEGRPTGIPTGSCEAAKALATARRLGGIDAMLRMKANVGDYRAPLPSAPFADWAEQIGLDRAAFLSVLSEESIDTEIREDVALGRKLAVEATPVVFLNGRRLEYWSNAESWELLLEWPADDAAASVPTSQLADADTTP